jgi:restriction system protein
MPRYWVLAPFSSVNQAKYDEVWEFDLENNLISIGWSQLGDVAQQSRDELASAIARHYPTTPLATRSLYANMIWNFYHEIAPGDLVIGRRGRRVLAAIGTVLDRAAFAPGRNPLLTTGPDVHSSYLPVDWAEHPRDRLFTTIVFPMHTLSELTEAQYVELAGEVIQNDGLSVTEAQIEDRGAFVLERYLEDFIVSNFQVIFRGQLQLYRDEQGAVAQQYNTNIGIIDILAVEEGTGSFVVIELKKGRPSDQVVGQLLRYMGWVKQTLCSPGQCVKGLVICREHDLRMSYALSMVPGVNLKYYSVSFSLSDVPNPPPQ